MNQWTLQPNVFAAVTDNGGGDLRRRSSSSRDNNNNHETVDCPKPRRIGLNAYRSLRYESEAETGDFLDLILTKDGYGMMDQVHTQLSLEDSSASPFFCGSPPSRVSNPITQDVRFRDDHISEPIQTLPLGLPQTSPRRGGCVRGGFGSNRPAVRIEGFDCLDRDNRNCSIYALA
ncbi:unnamed protein product [Cochlearia groenlandica]